MRDENSASPYANENFNSVAANAPVKFTLSNRVEYCVISIGSGFCQYASAALLPDSPKWCQGSGATLRPRFVMFSETVCVMFFLLLPEGRYESLYLTLIADTCILSLTLCIVLIFICGQKVIVN